MKRILTMIKDDAIPNAEDKDDFFKWHAASFRIKGLMNEFLDRNFNFVQ